MHIHPPPRPRRTRLLLRGSHGAGKAFRALLIAKGLAAGQLSRVIVIDTDDGTARHFPELGSYRLLTLSAPHTPERYLEALAWCEAAGAEVIVFNSLADCQANLLQDLADLADNSLTARVEAIVPYYALLHRVLTSPAHTIVCVPTHAKYWQSFDADRLASDVDNAQGAPVEDSSDGFTLVLDFERPQYANACHDKTRLFGGSSFRPGSATGRQLRNWCQEPGFTPDPTSAAPSRTLEPCPRLPAHVDFNLKPSQCHQLQPSPPCWQHHLLSTPHFSSLQPPQSHHHGNLSHAA